MKITRTILVLAILSTAACLNVKAAPISIDSPGSAYTQQFNSLAQSGTSHSWSNGSSIEGWYLFRQPDPGTAVSSYRVGTGSSSTSGFYSFGSDQSSDRALGGIGSGSFEGWIAVAFVNNSGSALSGFSTTWDGEQWHQGRNNSRDASMIFEYGFGDTFQSVPTWTAPGGSFNWTSPVTGASSAEVDGNVDGLVSDVGGDLDGIAWGKNETLWFRWVERDDPGYDHGLAIDDFSFTAQAASVPDRLPFGISALSFIGIILLSRRLRSA